MKPNQHRPALSHLPPWPSWSELLSNFAGATARWAAAGFPVAPREVAAARQAVCAECLTLDPETKRCRACGCFGVKVWLATERCPEGRWAEKQLTGADGRAHPPEVKTNTNL